MTWEPDTVGLTSTSGRFCPRLHLIARRRTDPRGMTRVNDGGMPRAPPRYPVAATVPWRLVIDGRSLGPHTRAVWTKE